MELKFEARNVPGRGHIEEQDCGTGIARINDYDIGTPFAASLSAKF